MKEKLSTSDLKSVTEAVNVARQWHSANMEASLEEITAEKKKLEDIYNPVMAKHMGAPG